MSDIGLPDEDGLVLIRRVRAMKAFSSLPAVALSSYASRNDVRRALAAGFHVHVAKPVEPEQLGRIIANVVDEQGQGHNGYRNESPSDKV